MSAKIPTRSSDYSGWYNAVIKQAHLAEVSATRGAMVIKPYGFALWERIKELLDIEFKATGHENAYFPLLIPAAHFTKEAAHVKGFAKECAVVTHYRLKEEAKKIVIDPSAQLQEPLVVRPTSETIIWSSFRKWIQSHRDLPLLINQWANVVRWEMRTRCFLRTSEFLWQEGHTAHATAKEAQAEALRMLNIYTRVIQDDLAIPLIQGEKTAHERFSGAENTFTMEALMQDGKALQLGTSHFLGQNFAKAFDVQFSSQTGERFYVWGTSWGVTTRLVGALIMTHSDDKGLVLPPRIAPIQVIIIPIYKKNVDPTTLIEAAKEIKQQLATNGIRVKVDHADTHHPGWKFTEYEQKGVPIRIAIGPRDLENQSVELVLRDRSEKKILPVTQLAATVNSLLTDMQNSLYQKANRRQESNTTTVTNFKEFKQVITEKKGFVLAHWDGTTQTEKAIKEATNATIRCIPFISKKEKGTCIYSGKPSSQQVLFAQAY